MLLHGKYLCCRIRGVVVVISTPSKLEVLVEQKGGKPSLSEVTTVITQRTNLARFQVTVKTFECFWMDKVNGNSIDCPGKQLVFHTEDRRYTSTIGCFIEQSGNLSEKVYYAVSSGHNSSEGNEYYNSRDSSVGKAYLCENTGTNDVVFIKLDEDAMLNCSNTIELPSNGKLVSYNLELYNENYFDLWGKSVMKFGPKGLVEGTFHRLDTYNTDRECWEGPFICIMSENWNNALVNKGDSGSLLVLKPRAGDMVAKVCGIVVGWRNLQTAEESRKICMMSYLPRDLKLLKERSNDVCDFSLVSNPGKGDLQSLDSGFLESRKQRDSNPESCYDNGDQEIAESRTRTGFSHLEAPDQNLYGQSAGQAATVDNGIDFHPTSDGLESLAIDLGAAQSGNQAMSDQLGDQNVPRYSDGREADSAQGTSDVEPPSAVLLVDCDQESDQGY